MPHDRRQFSPSLVWLAAALCCTTGISGRADTLVDIYELALENDALLKVSVAQYNADIELEKLALAPLLPQARAGYSFTDSENDSTSPNVYLNPETNALDQIDVTSVRETENEGYDVSLSQTLFDLSAWFGWRAGKESSQQAEANLSAAQQDLIVRVVQAYFGVLRAQDNLRASQAQERAFERQLEQTRQRFEVGLIAITDVYEAEAARDLAQVTRIVDENNVAVAKENLSVLTGQAPGALHVLGEGFAPKPPEPADRGAWVDFALSNNNQLAAARFAEEAARQNATAFRMGHAPTITATYRYQDTETTGSIRQNPDSLFNFAPDSEQTNESWQIRFDVPLAAGGAISANRRRAAEQFNAARETRINLSRNTVTQARSLHMTVMSDVSRVNARKQSIVSSQSAVDATQAGYEVGTRNIVDVLNAQNKLFAAQRDYANSRYDFVINSLRLKEVAGTLSPEDIARLESFLLEPAAPTASDASE
jgi:outer membrane protein